jgi:hypothetical protein
MGAIGVLVGASITFKMAVAGACAILFALPDHKIPTKIAKTTTAKMIAPKTTLRLNKLLRCLNMESLYRHQKKG